jgi:hypothetical protein
MVRSVDGVHGYHQVLLLAVLIVQVNLINAHDACPGIHNVFLPPQVAPYPLANLAQAYGKQG